MLRAVKRTRLYQEVEAQLAELIREGQLQPGDRLPPERELAERMQVSRASVREALRVMEQRGLVVSRPGTGTFIAGGTAEALARALTQLALEDIFELRMLLEPSIAALAAQRATAEDVAHLEAAVQEQEAEVRRGHSGVEADAAFHSGLAEGTHNRALLRLGAALMEELAPSRDESLQTPQRARLSLESHRHILEAIKAGAAEGARRAMEEHIRGVDVALFGLSREGTEGAKGDEGAEGDEGNEGADATRRHGDTATRRHGEPGSEVAVSPRPRVSASREVPSSHGR